MSVSYRAQTARVTGARHVRAGEMCQDAALCGVRGELAFYGLADGQSGARFGLEGAQAALTEANIRLIGGVQGSADEAVQAFLGGTLAFDPNVHCTHHDHAHGEGHSCGSHGCGGHCHG